MTWSSNMIGHERSFAFIAKFFWWGLGIVRKTKVELEILVAKALLCK